MLSLYPIVWFFSLLSLVFSRDLKEDVNSDFVEQRNPTIIIGRRSEVRTFTEIHAFLIVHSVRTSIFVLTDVTITST